jgi:hypothetical protein
MLADLWPEEQRPKYLQNRKKVNRMTMGKLMQFQTLYHEREKWMGKGAQIFGADPKIPTKKFREGKDNREDRIHEASLLRLPVADPEDYWEKIPLKREPIFRNIPLKHCGAENLVNELTIIRMHDRGVPVTLKMFHGANYAKRPGKDTDAGLDRDWDAPGKLMAVQEAVVNYSTICRALWPMDYTPDVVLRVMVANKWAASTGEPDATKMSIVAKFFDTLMLENAANALKKKAPADYRRAREIYARAVELHGGMTEQKETGGSGTREPDGGAAHKGQTNSGGRAQNRPGSGPGQKRPPPKMGNFFVCYRYNEKNGCDRQLQGQGCKGPNGQVFAHACTYVKQTGDYCLGYHSKIQHK